ncbi:Tyrosine decarboxylase 1, partial [Ananas comosus]
MDSEQLREYAHKMVVDFMIADYYKMSESFPVLSQVEPGYLKELLPDSAPSKPENLEDVFDDIRQKIIPGITHRQSPNYFAYYPSNSSTAGFLGEMLSAGFNIVGFSWIASSVATELEMLVLDWFAKSLSCLSRRGGTVIQGTASEAVLVVLLAARDKILLKAGRKSLEKLVVGTTSSAVVDPLLKLAKISKVHNMWFHVDNAHAGSSCICREYCHHNGGVEEADSF